MQKSSQIIELQDEHLALINLYKKSRQIKFPELTIFKHQLKNRIPTVLSYEFNKTKVKIYRSIFFCLALLLAALGIFLLMKNIVFTGMLLASLKPIIKGGICTVAFMLSGLAISICYSFRVAREATVAVSVKAKKQLFEVYYRKRMEYNFDGLFSIFQTCQKHALLKSAYREVLDTINEKQRETEELLNEILQTKNFKNAKQELVFGQALVQFEESLKQEIQAFKTFKI
jgi:hypothetical protein